MPAFDSPAEAVLDALGLVQFAREPSGALRLSGKAPSWLGDLWPALREGGGVLPVADASPFLENFLIDAEQCWRDGGGGQVKSGPWIETGSGAEIQLEATALTANGQALLLLERLGEAFEARKSVLQHARETVIAHQRLNSEIQKKEILLHCVADEMTAALANAITSLRLIELEDNGPRTKLLLGLATRATQEQQMLIHRILGVFEDELRKAYGLSSLTNTSAPWDEVMERALETASPLFVEKGVTLNACEGSTSMVQIPADAAQLERVIGNLLENALERTATGGAVIVRTENEPETLYLRVEDNGAPVALETGENLLGYAAPASAAALRLHFCRIVVKNCGGEIGCTALSGDGNRAWIRLTKITAP
ncbi:MAG: HAMP domain-containing sensor histidine kinase [Chthoniobacterales bacterium]